MRAIGEKATAVIRTKAMRERATAVIPMRARGDKMIAVEVIVRLKKATEETVRMKVIVQAATKEAAGPIATAIMAIVTTVIEAGPIATAIMAMMMMKRGVHYSFPGVLDEIF